MHTFQNGKRQFPQNTKIFHAGLGYSSEVEHLPNRRGFLASTASPATNKILCYESESQELTLTLLVTDATERSWPTISARENGMWGGPAFDLQDLPPRKKHKYCDS